MFVLQEISRGSVLLLIVMIGITLTPRTLAQPGVSHVWAVDEGEKVKQDQLNHWARNDARNPVWDGNSIRVFGARNEVVGFQVILEAAGGGATGVDVRLDSLYGPGYVITNTGGIGDPMDFVGKRIEIFVESYINVASRSLWGSTWGWSRPLPEEDHTGLLPDALVPVEAPNKAPANGAGGAPFPIAAGRTQGIWIDVYIPPDAPEGTYSGTVRVSENGTVSHNVPIALQVYGFTLPDTTHFHTMFAYGGLIAERHGHADGTPAFWERLHDYMNVFHRHRIDLNLGNKTLSNFDANLGGYFTGVYYSGNYGYDGPGVGTGNQTYGIGVYDQPENGWASGFWPDSMLSWQLAADAWENWFRNNAPAADRFKFLTDEPSPAEYGPVIEHGSWIRSSAGAGSSLRTYCTVKIDPRLYGSVNYWSLTGQSGYDPGDGVPVGYMTELVKQRRALGEKVGLYNGTRPGFGVPELLDNTLADNRVNPWIAFKHDIDQYFLWIVGYITGLPLDRNVWVDNFTGTTASRSWGEGQYVYPGEDTKHPADSRGVQGPIVSIRMKNFRRGMQDYEYLWLARQAGVSEDTISAIINSVVPAALDEVPQTSQPQFAERGYTYETARLRLAEILARTSSGGVLPPVRSPSAGTLHFASAGRSVPDKTTILDSLLLTTSGQPLKALQFRLVTDGRTIFRSVRRGGRVPEQGWWFFTNLQRGPVQEDGSVSDTCSVVILGTGTATLPADTSMSLAYFTYDVVNTPSAGPVTTSFKLIDVVGALMDGSNAGIVPGGAQTVSVRNGLFKGDVNGDDRVDVLDVILVVDHVLQRALLPPEGVLRADISPWPGGDSTVDVRDLALIESTILAGFYPDGAPLAAVPIGTIADNLHKPATGSGGAEAVVRASIGGGRMTIHLRNPAPVKGVQWEVAGIRIESVSPASSPDFGSNSWISDSLGARGLSYSSQGSVLPPGEWLIGDFAVARQSGANSPRGEAGIVYADGNQMERLGILLENEKNVDIPPDFSLDQNFPNPFNPVTTVRFALPGPAHVRLTVYTLLGELVATLVDEPLDAGVHNVVFDAKALSSGMYFYRLEAGRNIATKKMLLVH